MPRTWALGLFTLAACGAPQLTSATQGLDATPRALTFTRAFIGYPQSQSVLVENRGATTLDVKLDVTAPFSVDSTSLELAGGESHEVQVAFAPAKSGLANATLAISADSLEPIEVALSGTAESAPVCTASDECHASSFDASQAACVQAAVPDGTTCGASNLCLVDASCAGGACVGQSRSCDDGNICTEDACDPAQGCVHVSTTASCPPPPDACHVATCDPSSGCGIADAPDWTPCGAMSCTQAHVCFSGSCLAVTPPDGMPCGQPTPCSAAPTCQAGACVRPDGGALPLLWSYAPPADASVVSLGPADAHGDVFWLESASTAPDSLTYAVVSATHDGQLRFRVPITISGVPSYPTPAVVAGDTLVVVTQTGSIEATGGLEAFSTDDGGELWSNDLRTPSVIGPNESFDAHAPVYDGVGNLFVAIDVLGTSYECPSQDRGMMLDVDLKTGAVVRTGTVVSPGLWGWHTPVLRSRAGELFGWVRGDECSDCDSFLAGLSSRLSNVDFHIDAGCNFDDVIALAGDVMLTGDVDATKVRSASDGHVLGSLQGTVGGEYQPCVLAGTAAYALTLATSSPATSEISAFSIPEGHEVWRRSFAVSPQGLVLTNHGTLLTTTTPDDGGFESLVETLSDGGAGFSCTLDSTGAHWGGAEQVLLNGRWIKLANDGRVVIRAYALPGYDIADGGWVAPGGNMERNGYVP